MSTDTTTEMEDDVTLVEAEAAEAEAAKAEAEAEKRNADLLKTVGKILGTELTADEKKQEEHSGGDETNSPAEGAEKEPDDLSQALKDRASEAGISDDLALRLHQSGLLEEALAAWDRQAIDRIARGSKKEEQKAPPPKKEEEKAAHNREGGEEELPPLDAELFDEELVKRDAFYREQISELREQVAKLTKATEGVSRLRANQFQQWFDRQVAGLKNAKLFGDGEIVAGSEHHKNRQTLCDGYERICEARGVDPYECHEDLLKRAYPAMFQEEVFKAAQREVVERLRDAQGRFVQPSKSAGNGPPLKKRQTPEEANDALVRKVEGILKAPAK